MGQNTKTRKKGAKGVTFLLLYDFVTRSTKTTSNNPLFS